jgi:hypothetical protein
VKMPAREHWFDEKGVKRPPRELTPAQKRAVEMRQILARQRELAGHNAK